MQTEIENAKIVTVDIPKDARLRFTEVPLIQIQVRYTQLHQACHVSLELLVQLLDTMEVDSLNRLGDLIIRVKRTTGPNPIIVAVGHPIYDQWVETLVDMSDPELR